MKNWRDNILDGFIPNVSKLTLVSDPDGLLTEEKLALALRQRGFDLIEFNNPVEFRYAYESQYRSIWDQGGHTDLVVILRLQDSELKNLPYDLLQAGRKLSFDLGGLFPNLSYPVIEKLDRSLLDGLFEVQIKSPPDRMGDNATKDYILRHVFCIAAELILTDVDLLRTLLRIHYQRIKIPQILTDRFIQVLRQSGGFHTWPLGDIVPDEQAFLYFLQERWSIFIERMGSTQQTCEISAAYDLKYQGPEDLPFDHQDVLVYIDNLFVERRLTPIQISNITIDPGSWIRCGIIQTAIDFEDERITRLFNLIETGIPTIDSRYSDWTTFALKWAELSSFIYNGSTSEQKIRFIQLGKTLNKTFTEWLEGHYASLVNLPPTNPVMLHHVARRIARDIEDNQNNRIVLLVMDGLALDQWVTIRQILQEQDRTLIMRESATFAWIPTLTSVSRQSIFSGKAPIYFSTTINTTNSESNHWKLFWESAGLSRQDIAYGRGLGDGDVVQVLDDILNPGKTRVVGLVIDKVDKIMHGMQLGAAGMHNQIKQWCNDGFLSLLIGYLLGNGYEVWLTSDHGNIECCGKGRPSEGAIAESRGERVRVYPTPELRSSMANKFPFAFEWEPIGLPSGYYPLVAEDKDAFILPNETIVGHGGFSIEEVIVPLVKFERRT